MHSEYITIHRIEYGGYSFLQNSEYLHCEKKGFPAGKT